MSHWPFHTSNDSHGKSLVNVRGREVTGHGHRCESYGYWVGGPRVPEAPLLQPAVLEDTIGKSLPKSSHLKSISPMPDLITIPAPLVRPCLTMSFFFCQEAGGLVLAATRTLTASTSTPFLGSGSSVKRASSGRPGGAATTRCRPPPC